MNIIIGYAGYACSGKDTASKALENLILKQAKDVIKIEDPTTLVAGTLCTAADEAIILWHVPLALGVKLEFVEEQKELGVQIDLRRLLYDSEYKCQFRKGLIAIGDGRRNTVHPLYWIHKVQKIIEHLAKEYPDQKHIYQITDMRYQNEIPEFEDYVYANGISMLSVKVLTRLDVIIDRMLSSGVVDFMRMHRLNPSEKNIKRVEADIEINNNTTKRALKKQIQTQMLPVVSMILFGDKNKLGKPSILARLLARLSSFFDTYL